MANVIDRQITEEGPRNIVVKFTGILDTSDIAETPCLSPAEFFNNDTGVILTGFRVDLLEWSISNPLELQLSWAGLNPQQIFPLAGRGRIYANNYGGFVPDTTRMGYTGALNLISQNFQPGSVANFSLVLELIKLYRV